MRARICQFRELFRSNSIYHASPKCLRTTTRPISRRYQHNHPTSSPDDSSSNASSLPRFLQPAIWRSIIPSFLNPANIFSSSSRTGKLRNPATYFIWIYLFIGSQAIRIISLQNEHSTFVRRADLKLALLREVVEKLQRGEQVDVESALGTGDENSEREWEEALREIEEEERVWQINKRKKREERERTEEEGRKVEAEKGDASPVVKERNTDANEARDGRTRAAPGFY